MSAQLFRSNSSHAKRVTRTTIMRLFTFAEFSLGLAAWKYCLDVNAHGTLWTVLSADDGKTETLLSGALFEFERFYDEWIGALALTRHCAEFGCCL
jgi:hypothetical protein